VDRDSVFRAHVLKHPPQPVVGDGGDQVRHDPELGAAERRRDGIAAERHRVGGCDVLFVAGWHVVGNEGNVDIGLSDEEGLHSFSVVAEGWSRPALYISTGYAGSFAKIIRKASALIA